MQGTAVYPRGETQRPWPAMIQRRAACALLVGGDRPMQLMLRYLLTLNGCDAVAASDVPTLETVAPPTHITLLVVIADDADQHIIGALARLRRCGYHAPTVVLAHAPTRALRQQAFAFGAQDVIAL